MAGLDYGTCPGDGQDWLVSQVVLQDCPHVWVVVRSHAGFPGGLAMSWCFSGPQMVPLLLTYGPCHACLVAPPGHCWSFLLVLNV